MAAEAAAISQPVSAQLIGNAFVQQYYHILHHSPWLVHKFYKDKSKLGRPEDDGSMTITTNMDAINEKILSLKYGDFRAEIKSVDTQDSLNGGVQVLVTGYLTGLDNRIHKFSQCFFLAPQDGGGFFVLNDIFRYVESSDVSDGKRVSVDNVATPVVQKQSPVSPTVQENHASDVSGHVDEVTEGQVFNPLESGDSPIVVDEVRVPEVVDEVCVPEVVDEVCVPEVLDEVRVPEVVDEVRIPKVVDEVHVPEVVDEVRIPKVVDEVHVPKVVDEVRVPMVVDEVRVPEVVDEVRVPEVVDEVRVPEVVDEVHDDLQLVRESDSKVAEVQKKSYASIVMHLKEKPVPFSSLAPAPRKSPQKSQEQQLNPPPVSESDGQIPSFDASDNLGNAQEGGAGYSIYLKGLPTNATVSLLENEFKKFGPIRRGGIQVRSNRIDGFCFGFVEFEVASAVEKALEASPIAISGSQTVIEEKRSTYSRGNNRGRFQQGRGFGFRNEGLRGRGGGYGGGYGGGGRGGGYYHGDSNGRGEYFNSRGRPSSRGDDGYQRAGGNNGGGRRSVNNNNRLGGGGMGNGMTKTMAPRISATA